MKFWMHRIRDSQPRTTPNPRKGSGIRDGWGINGYPVDSLFSDRIYRIEEDMFSRRDPKTQRKEQHGNAFPSVSISVHSSVALRAMGDTQGAKEGRIQEASPRRAQSAESTKGGEGSFLICGNLPPICGSTCSFLRALGCVRKSLTSLLI